MNENEADVETESQPFRGRKYGPCLKILTQITLEDENELAEIREVSQKKLTSESFDNDNKLTLKSFFAFCSVFLQGPTEETWKRLRERHNARFPKFSSVTLKSKNLQRS